MKIRVEKYPLTNKLFTLDGNGFPIPCLSSHEVQGFDPGKIKIRRQEVLLAVVRARSAAELKRRFLVQSVKLICREGGHIGTVEWRRGRLGKHQFKQRVKEEIRHRIKDLIHYQLHPLASLLESKMPPKVKGLNKKKTANNRIIPWRNAKGELTMEIPF